MSIPYDEALVEQVAHTLDLRAPNQAALDKLALALDSAEPGQELVADLATGVGQDLHRWWGARLPVRVRGPERRHRDAGFDDPEEDDRQPHARPPQVPARAAVQPARHHPRHHRARRGRGRTGGRQPVQGVRLHRPVAARLRQGRQGRPAARPPPSRDARPGGLRLPDGRRGPDRHRGRAPHLLLRLGQEVPGRDRRPEARRDDRPYRDARTPPRPRRRSSSGTGSRRPSPTGT